MNTNKPVKSFKFKKIPEEAKANYLKSFEETSSTVIFKDLSKLIQVVLDKVQRNKTPSSFDQALSFIKVIPNIRTLKENELVTFFKLLDNLVDIAHGKTRHSEAAKAIQTQ
mmetsp:Transcript_4139/g.6153  ORF Transcript_4139/g.6153 Transcript_4139/m.6153 type:complete len:111 (-) Transcript_4139:1926-2258(-)